MRQKKQKFATQIGIDLLAALKDKAQSEVRKTKSVVEDELRSHLGDQNS